MAWESTTMNSLPTRNGNASTSANRLNSAGYELSDDLIRRQVECLEKKYGGQRRSHSAATKIQRAYRIFKLQQQFKSASNRESAQNGFRPIDKQQNNGVNLHLKYQPTNSLRTQLFAIRSGQVNVTSPRKNSTPNMEPRLSGRSFNESVLSPRLIKRHDFSSPPAAFSTPTRVCGVSPVVWVQNRQRHDQITPIKSVARSSKSSIHFEAPDSPASSLTPSDSISMSPSHGHQDLSRMNCQNSISSNSLENFVQMDSMLPLNGTRDRSTPPSDNHHQNSTTSSSSVETNDQAKHQCAINTNYKVQNRPLFVYKAENPEQKRRRMYRVALNLFNKKPDRGIQMLIDWRYVDDHPIAIAKFMLTRRGLGKKMIGEFLGTLRSEFHAAVLRSVLVEIEMKGQEIDEALRTMIYFFQLPTEAQKIDYIMQAFAQRYYDCNSYRLSESVTSDAIYVLSFAIIMLNTDQHSPSIKSSQRMNVNQFVKNTWGAFDTHAFDQDVLIGIYERIRKAEICPGNDHVTQVSKVEQTITGRDKPRLTEQHRRLICYCRVNEIASPTKKQTLSQHQREIFLFNDMILVTKTASHRRKDSAQYILRQWTTLLGLEIDEFDSDIFSHAMKVTFPNRTTTFLLNAKNANDRVRFIADVRESVAECEDMERVRLAFELNRQSEVRRETSRAMSAASSVVPTTNEHSRLESSTFEDAQ